MKLPELPEPIVVDGRILFTKAQVRAYGKACYEAGVEDEELYTETEIKKDSPKDPAVEALMHMFGMKP